MRRDTLRQAGAPCSSYRLPDFLGRLELITDLLGIRDPDRARYQCLMGLLVGLVLAWPIVSFSQSSTVESDPSVVSVLPKNYPLNRVRVAAREYPWSAIGLVTMLGGRHTCTGTLISDRFVLTAAHCVFRYQRFPKEVNFLAGYEQDRYVAHSKAKRLYVSEAFRGERPSLRIFATDWALIELEEPVGTRAGYLGWAYFDANVLQQMGDDSTTFKVAGYRGDRRFVQTVDHECGIAGFTEGEGLIVHRCPITGGDSGGPVLLSYQDELLVVGVDVGVQGKRSQHLGRGDDRNGFAVPSVTFQNKLIALGLGGEPLTGSGNFSGRFGRRP